MTLPSGRVFTKMLANWSANLMSSMTVDPEVGAKFITSNAQSSELHPSFSARTVSFSTTCSSARWGAAFVNQFGWFLRHGTLWAGEQPER